MKKAIKSILIIFAFILLVFVTASFFLNTLIKTGVERFGPKITGTSVSVSKIDISPFSGNGKIEGLVIGNPKGFQTESAIRLQDIRISLDLKSILNEKLIIKEIFIKEPEMTFEGSLGRSNIGKIQDNIQSFKISRTSDQEKEAFDKDRKSPDQKVQIKRFIMKQPRVKLSTTILKGKAATISIPDIRLNEIGENSEGITLEEAFLQIFKAIHMGITKAVSDSGSVLEKGAESLERSVDDLGGAAKEGGSKALKGLQDLMGK